MVLIYVSYETKMATICISHPHGQKHEHAEQHVEMFSIITKAYS